MGAGLPRVRHTDRIRALITTMTATLQEADPPNCARGPRHPAIQVNGAPVHLTDPTPTGEQILNAAGLRPAPEFVLLLWPPTGPTREMALDEVIEADPGGTLDFLASRGDGVSYFMLDDERYAWTGPLTGADIRRVGRVPDNLDLVFERPDQPDVEVGRGDLVPLHSAGVERLRTRKKLWKLDVHGEMTEWDRPNVSVREALVAAGKDVSRPYIIVFKTKSGNRQVELGDILNLDQPGIERLWLRPKKVDNGDASHARRRDFSLLAKDVAFLDRMGYEWDTIDDGRRWIVVRNYPLPSGYQVASCALAVEMPVGYPTSEIDMFYCNPPLRLPSGSEPDRADVRQAIDGMDYQRWSRHREPGTWSVDDCVATHFGLVELAISREVGQ